MKKIAVIYYWPNSQVCIDCKYGKLLCDDDKPSSYACIRYSLLNDGIDCPKKETNKVTEKEAEK